MNKPPTAGAPVPSSPPTGPRSRRARVRAGLRRRYRRERRFRLYGAAAVLLALACLGTLFVTIVGNGYSAFGQTYVGLAIDFDADAIDPEGRRDPETLSTADYGGLVKRALRAAFPDVRSRGDRRDLYRLISTGAQFDLREMVLDDPHLIGTTTLAWLPASDDVDMVVKGHVSRDVPEIDRTISDAQIAWLDRLAAAGAVDMRLNTRFFTSGDSREPELAGLWGATVGTMLTLAVTLALSFPLGVATAAYLEEFAPRNRWTELIEVNINNLAAVPSIVFGLLGLAVFLNVLGMPRSAPVVGGIVLAVMTLPTIIIAGRAALTSVPPSIREAALAVGASRVQTVLHHVLPLAMPGILTGSIIGMARALGETAPLLMIGMVAFIVDIPGDFSDPATVLPVQIYLWADSPERAFVERTSGAIIVLLVFLIGMNGLAVWLRNRFEKRW